MKKLLILSTLSLGALALTPGSAHAELLIIDDFNNGLTDEQLSGPLPSTFTGTVAAPGIIGGSRDIDFDLILAENDSRRAELFINGDNDTLTLSNGSSANSTVQLDYGPGLNQPISSPGDFVFPIIANDAVDAFIAVSVNGSAPVTLPVPAPGTNLTFPNSLFGNPTTLDSFSVLITGGVSNDVEIDQIGYQFDDPVIPEPMTILGTVFVLGAIPKLKKAYGKKKAQ